MYAHVSFLFHAHVSYALLNHEQVALDLIKAGASLQIASQDNFTMLMAASLGGLVSVVERVLPISDVNGQVVATHETQGGYSALMYSSMRGDEKIAQILMQAGADTKVVASNGATALSLAREKKHEGICELLQAFDADALCGR